MLLLGTTTIALAQCQSTTIYFDADGDGYPGTCASGCFYGPLPTGWDYTDYGLIYDCGADNDPMTTGGCDQIICYSTDDDGDGWPVPLDCNDGDASVHPNAAELCSNGTDDNCDGVTDPPAIELYPDADGDGYGTGSTPTITACSILQGFAIYGNDCDDTNPTIFPDRGEDCNGIDDNCNGDVDEGASYCDWDGDGYTSQFQGDCDDFNPAISPGATEVCNGYDDNCDGIIDQGCYDTDGDGYAIDQGDCNDLNAAINPAAAEVCNGFDDDCDGLVDQGFETSTYYRDFDNDGHGDNYSPLVSCYQPEGFVSDNTDCDDFRTWVYPGATEQCNGMDDDCDGSMDEGYPIITWHWDYDGDGYGNFSQTFQSCYQPAYIWIPEGLPDCNDGDADVHPGATEVCNSIDDNCNSVVDEGCDADGDGYTVAQGDCNDANAAIHPGSTETCNSVDDNCNSQTDEGVQSTFYRDQDGDGYGSASVTTLACSPPSGYVSNNTDCNDNSASIHPGATETCSNNIDDNCNGQIDEGCGGCTMTVNAGSDQDTYYGYSGGQTITHTAAVTGGTAPYTYSWTLLTYPETPVARPLMCNNINNAGDESFYISNTSGANICGTSGATCTNNACPSSGSPTSAPVLSGANAARVTMTLLDSAIVRVTVTDANNCTATDDFIVRAEDVRCWSGNNQKIKICHKTGNSCVTICIDENAWAAHQAHGDFVGKCNANCTAREEEFFSEDENGSSLILYPNPAEGAFTVEFTSLNFSNDEATIQVVNMIGQKVYEERKQLADGELQSEIRLENQPEGVYLVRVIVDEHVMTTPLVLSESR